MGNFGLFGIYYAVGKIEHYYSIFKFHCIHADIFLSFAYVLQLCIKYCSIFSTRAIENCLCKKVRSNFFFHLQYRV